MKTPQAETIPVIWPETLEIAGAVDRKFAHEFGIPHMTVLLLVFRAADSRIAVYLRSHLQSFPGRKDFFGGHCCFQPTDVDALAGGDTDVAELIRQTAVREANEELGMVREDKSRFRIHSQNVLDFIRQVGQIGEFSVANPKNVERSSLFAVRIPPGISITPCDEVAGEIFPVEVEWLTLDELLFQYQTQRERFADGADRILNRATNDAAFRALLHGEIESFSRDMGHATSSTDTSVLSIGRANANMERAGTLVILACHGVYDSQSNEFYGEHPSDRPIYEAQLCYALRHLEWRRNKSPRLVISGGPTKKQLQCSESRSYLQMAAAMGLKMPANVVLEEFGLTSIENVLFSLHSYLLSCGHYPEEIDVISWEFKRERFEQTLDAINRWQSLGPPWPKLNFFPVGDLWGSLKEKALKDERDYIASLTSGLEGYYKNPKIQNLLEERDVFNSRARAKRAYTDLPMPF